MESSSYFRTSEDHQAKRRKCNAESARRSRAKKNEQWTQMIAEHDALTQEVAILRCRLNESYERYGQLYGLSQMLLEKYRAAQARLDDINAVSKVVSVAQHSASRIGGLVPGLQELNALQRDAEALASASSRIVVSVEEVNDSVDSSDSAEFDNKVWTPVTPEGDEMLLDEAEGMGDVAGTFPDDPGDIQQRQPQVEHGEQPQQLRQEQRAQLHAGQLTNQQRQIQPQVGQLQVLPRQVQEFRPHPQLQRAVQQQQQRLWQGGDQERRSRLQLDQAQRLQLDQPQRLDQQFRQNGDQQAQRTHVQFDQQQQQPRFQFDQQQQQQATQQMQMDQVPSDAQSRIQSGQLVTQRQWLQPEQLAGFLQLACAQQFTLALMVLASVLALQVLGKRNLPHLLPKLSYTLLRDPLPEHELVACCA